MKALEIFLYIVLLATVSALFGFKPPKPNFNITYTRKVREDALLLVPDLIQKYGYPCEKHNITTEDGYMLELHRIPYGLEPFSTTKPIVLLNHGLGASSADWVLKGPGQSLGYILADNNYDVWLINARGNRYCYKHKTLNPRKQAMEFWDFSWHEIATIDLPTIIDYVLNLTGQKKVFYIGHSQGNTVSYVLCSEKPEYNDKIRAVINLAPSAFLSNMKVPIIPQLAAFERVFQIVSKVINLHNLSIDNKVTAELGQILCAEDSSFQLLCLNVYFMLFGYSPNQVNATIFPTFLGHVPAGASLKQVLHYAQNLNTGKFRKWNYGYLQNIKHYGRPEPPDYKLQNLKVPFYFFYARNDWVNTEADITILYNKLPNVKKMLVADPQFNHLDFLYGTQAPELVYKQILKIMQEH